MVSVSPVNRVQRVLKSVNCDGRYGLALACACGALLLLVLTGEGGRALLRYDRTALAAGQAWRLITAHVVHLDLRHALLNCLGLALMWALFARDYAPGLWLCDSTVEWYVGSSGVLHGIMAAGTLAQLRRGERTGWVLLGFLALKLSYEHWVGALPLAGSVVVVDAHLFGVAGGSAAAAFLKPRSGSL